MLAPSHILSKASLPLPFPHPPERISFSRPVYTINRVSKLWVFIRLAVWGGEERRGLWAQRVTGRRAAWNASLSVYINSLNVGVVYHASSPPAAAQPPSSGCSSASSTALLLLPPPLVSSPPWFPLLFPSKWLSFHALVQPKISAHSSTSLIDYSYCKQ